jgi:hypothetical protein
MHCGCATKLWSLVIFIRAGDPVRLPFARIFQDLRVRNKCSCGFSVSPS